MTKAEWDMVRCGDWCGKLNSGDQIKAIYRMNWHSGRSYKKPDYSYTGKLLCLTDRGITFESPGSSADILGKRLSYKSIIDIGFLCL